MARAEERVSASMCYELGLYRLEVVSLIDFDWTVLIPLLSGLIGALVGGGIGYFAQIRTLEADLAVRRKSLAQALAAEIEAFQRIVNRRDMPARCQAAADAARAGNENAVREWLSEQDGRMEILSIYHANLGNIGLLGPVCVELVTFVGLVQAILSTIRGAHEGIYDKLDGGQVADLFESELGLWRLSEKLATKVIADLRAIT